MPVQVDVPGRFRTKPAAVAAGRSAIAERDALAAGRSGSTRCTSTPHVLHLRVSSAAFRDVPLMHRHRMVMDALTAHPTLRRPAPSHVDDLPERRLLKLPLKVLVEAVPRTADADTHGADDEIDGSTDLLGDAGEVARMVAAPVHSALASISTQLQAAQQEAAARAAFAGAGVGARAGAGADAAAENNPSDAAPPARRKRVGSVLQYASCGPRSVAPGSVAGSRARTTPAHAAAAKFNRMQQQHTRAAVTIQRRYRMHLHVALDVLARRAHRASTAICKLWRGHASRTETAAHRRQCNRGAAALQAVWKGRRTRLWYRGVQTVRNVAATHIQRAARGRAARNTARWMRLVHHVVRMQAWYRGMRGRQYAKQYRWDHVVIPGITRLQAVRRGIHGRRVVRGESLRCCMRCVCVHSHGYCAVDPAAARPMTCAPGTVCCGFFTSRRANCANSSCALGRAPLSR